MADDLTLIVGSNTLSGWTDIRVTRSIEACTGDFELGMTQLQPAELQAVTVQPGDACQVILGSDLVITGYVNTVTPSLDPRGHEIRVTGRGKCQDLVDCSAEWPGGLISNSTLLGIATKLAAPYGISVAADPNVDVGAPIPKVLLRVMETPFDVLDRIARYRGVLLYEMPDGSLYLGAVTTSSKAASGIVEGQNLERGTARYSDAQRFQTYQAFLLNTAILLETGDAGNLIATVSDNTVLRNRKHAIVAEFAGETSDLSVTTRRATWERNRRYGHGMEVRPQVDSWRDSAGALWSPNSLVDLDIPSLMPMGPKTWLIGDVTYFRDAKRGTGADLVIMPPEGFSPEPIVLQPLPPDVAAALAARGIT
jgi:prophage tail gpP-like protein